MQGLADYALHSAGGRVTGHSAVYTGNLPWHFRLRQSLAHLAPHVFSQPLLPGAGASQVLI